MSGYRRQATPKEVERSLRREAGFGCAKCGHPYIEYHHIVPFASDKHFRVEDMVAVCGNCHPEISGFGLGRQYRIKSNPFNISRGVFSGALSFDRAVLDFDIGNLRVINTPILLQAFDTPLISCRIDEGQVLVSMVFFDDELRPLLRIVDNEIEFRVDDIWDFEYKFNYVVVRCDARDTILKLDFRNAQAAIETRFNICGQGINISRRGLEYGGNKIFGGSVSNCRTAVQLHSKNESIYSLLGLRRNALCPCGSSLRVKACHGKPAR